MGVALGHKTQACPDPEILVRCVCGGGGGGGVGGIPRAMYKLFMNIMCS